MRYMERWTGIILMVVFIILICINAIDEFYHAKEIKRLNDVIGYIFNDYCAERGGVIPIFSIEVYLDEIDTTKDTSYLRCADDSDSGILVVQDDSAVYFIPEGK